MTTDALEDRTPQSLLHDQIEPFLKHLRAAGYAESTLRKKRSVIRAFARWAKRKRIAADDLNSGSGAAFVARSKAEVAREVRTRSHAAFLELSPPRDRTGTPTPASGRLKC